MKSAQRPMWFMLLAVLALLWNLFGLYSFYVHVSATPEVIVQSYDTLKLPDVYAVLAYYLTHRDEVHAYLARRAAEADALRREIEAVQPARPDLRERLLRRARMQEGGRDPSAQ